MSGTIPSLDAGRIEKRLEGVEFVSSLIVLDCVDSTNRYLRSLARAGAAAGTVVLADRQTEGRGRRGQAWYSPPGLGLYVSVLLHPGDQAEKLTRWTLAAAVAACRACRRISGSQVEIKWPNDLLWSGRKLGGVLAETRTPGEGSGELVVGTGLNVGHGTSDFPDELSCTATSLAIAANGLPPEREELAAEYLRELADAVRELQRGAWHTVADRWESLAPGSNGARVRIRCGNGSAKSYVGLTQGLDPLGALRVLREDGRVVSVRLAESVLPPES